MPASSGWPADEARRPAHSTLRLQPVILGPPPDPDLVGASAADDLDPLEFGRSASRGGVFAALGAIILVTIAAGGAYWHLAREQRDAESPPPPAAALPSEAPAVPVPAPQASLPEAPSPSSEAPAAARAHELRAAVPPVPHAAERSPAVDMVEVGNDLVAPITDGLRPARKVQTIRIVVDGDRELPQLR